MNPAWIGLVIATSVTWVSLFRWRPARHFLKLTQEVGQASTSTIIITVALICAVSALTILDKQVPNVLTQGLASMFFGVASGEITLRRAIKKAVG